MSVPGTPLGLDPLRPQFTSLAAGNALDVWPVTLVGLPGMASGSTLATRLPVAWTVARSLVAPHPATAMPVLPLAAEPVVVIAELALGLRRLNGLREGRLLRIRGSGGWGHAGIAAPEQEASMAALRAAAALLLAPEGSQPSPAVKVALSALRREAWLREGTWASAAATRLGIPWRVAASAPNPFVVLGHGHHRRLFWRHMAGANGQLGVGLSDDKRLSSEVLRRAGLPAPSQYEASDEEVAIRAAEALGWPVVVKPATSGGGKGVTAGIHDRGGVAAAFALAKPYGPVVVEKHVEGYHHRLFVLRGRCISAQRFEPAHVVGDGRRTVAELLEATNALRTEQLSAAFKKIQFDDNARAMLRRQGLALHDVPEAGRRVAFRSQSNLSSGGTYTIVTDTLHPDTRRVAEAAARLFDIEICGVDFITPDASRSWLEVGGAINEVNKNPSFMLGGEEADWADVIIGDWFPAPGRGRIPAAIVLARAEISGLAAAVGELLHEDISQLALVSAEAVRFGGLRSRGAAPLPRQVEAALADPIAAALVVDARPADLVRDGLGLDRCDLMIAAPGLAADDARAVAALARLASILVLPPAAPPPVVAAAAQAACVVVAEAADTPALIAAAAAALKSGRIAIAASNTSQAASEG